MKALKSIDQEAAACRKAFKGVDAMLHVGHEYELLFARKS